MTVLWAGLICWLVTLIIVESELFRPVRERLTEIHPKLAYLSGCHLCTGTWVGIGMALIISGPFGFFLLNGLLFKAVGHIALEIVAVFKKYTAEG